MVLEPVSRPSDRVGASNLPRSRPESEGLGQAGGSVGLAQVGKSQDARPKIEALRAQLGS